MFNFPIWKFHWRVPDSLSTKYTELMILKQYSTFQGIYKKAFILLDHGIKNPLHLLNAWEIFTVPWLYSKTNTLCRWTERKQLQQSTVAWGPSNPVRTAWLSYAFPQKTSALKD